CFFRNKPKLINMKYLVIIFVFLFSALVAFGQSKTTENLQKKYSDSFSLFFYQNTLRMINQSGNKEFDELIKDIEKMKFLMVDKKEQFKAADYSKLKGEYISETFEEVMTTRYEGRNLDILMKEKAGKTQGMVVLVNDSTSLYVLDVVGSIALDKVTTLYKTLDQSTDIGQRIKSFADRNSKRKDSDKQVDDH
ncbi:MAG TPA: DUF4252 domain-containing protein, partial [Cyclobacteriaceae bacterium]|nr:DUF4252 domain-containing protein [Cyclobacteriaceae bacterium]